MDRDGMEMEMKKKMRDRHHTSKKCGVGNNNEKKSENDVHRENREIKIKKISYLSLSPFYTLKYFYQTGKKLNTK